MDTWNRLTNLRVGGGDQKGLAKNHICIYVKPMDTDSNVVKARGGGAGDW